MDKTIIYRRMTLVSAVALLIVLIAIQLLPLAYSVPTLVGQTASQSTRAQRIAKDALVLAYRPASEHAQSISEIQNTLPVWEAEQAYLGTFHNAEVQSLMAQAQPDYVALDVAARQLLAHPTDMTQVVIIIQHERNYTLTMNQLLTLIQSRIQAFRNGIIIIQCGIVALVLALVIVFFVLSRQPKTKKEKL